ncbi:glutathione hydrolase 5 proenzyme isoform X2 [Rhinichthys klamathensis goyatoka]|uniref:glutathione hydrolase 5 proenzyme isoform X2 n=1 Tax=Rhinichthys klamathensis goyatoka TaxID=3034132 RepID=UPI0024B4A182|nr:glutathione hydrolase 5 proenzyme isoform X2 [Rhinichthys klamathensis goyatoka]
MGKSQSRRCCLCVLALLSSVAIIRICIILATKQRCAFTNAAVAADSLMCSDVGRDMLVQGGSAVDAAIAALLCTGLVNPQSMGLGGGAIFTIMDKTGKVKIISSRETVPKNVRADLLNKCSKKLAFETGSHWIGVPGEIRGYERAHQLYGKLPWAKLFEPSIKLAREGFPMPVFLCQFLQMIKQTNYSEQLIYDSGLCELFCHKNKTFFGPGDILKFPRLAETLETIAKEGADAFYTGKIAKDLIQDVQARNGTLSLEDLSTFKVRESDAWTVQIGDYKMHFPPPPAGGAILSFILKLMHEFGLSPASNHGDQKTLTLHRFLEAVKFANGQKCNLKDPLFNSNMTYITDEKFIQSIRALITDRHTHDPSYYNIAPSVDRFGTTHVSVMAADGTAVSVTSTINHMFGSAVYSPKTGIILNNELADFCGRADNIKPGEQPPSSMAPAILQSVSQQKTLVIGGSGGSMITTAMALSIMNHLWFGMNLNESIAAKIVFVDTNNNLNFEKGYNESLIKAMKALGHKEKHNSYFFNVVNGISKEGQCISAVSDARKHGRSAGY